MCSSSYPKSCLFLVMPDLDFIDESGRTSIHEGYKVEQQLDDAAGLRVGEVSRMVPRLIAHQVLAAYAG